MGVWATLLHGVAGTNGVQLVAATALQALSLLVLTAPGGGRLPMSRAALCATAAVLAGLLALVTISPQASAWPFDFATYLLALLTIRGSAVEGVGGGATLIAAGLAFGDWTGRPAPDMVAFVALPTTALLVGIVWRVAIAAALEREAPPPRAGVRRRSGDRGGRGWWTAGSFIGVTRDAVTAARPDTPPRSRRCAT